MTTLTYFAGFHVTCGNCVGPVTWPALTEIIFAVERETDSSMSDVATKTPIHLEDEELDEIVDSWLRESILLNCFPNDLKRIILEFSKVFFSSLTLFISVYRDLQCRSRHKKTYIKSTSHFNANSISICTPYDLHVMCVEYTYRFILDLNLSHQWKASRNHRVFEYNWMV